MTSNRLTTQFLRTIPLPRPDGGSKEHRGTVLVVAGSEEVPGAALLTGVATLRAGAGKLQIATVQSVALSLALVVPEAKVIGLPCDGSGLDSDAAVERILPLTERADAVSIGTGMHECTATATVTAALCKAGRSTFVLDAASLSDLRSSAEDVRACGGKVVITPHAGEMAQLLDRSRDEIEADPLAAAREAADLFQAVVVMKGAETHVVTWETDHSWIFRGGSVGLATSGSGDVLAGIVAGLLARGTAPIHAALWGVYLHGEAGHRLANREGTMGFLARDLAAEIPRIMDDVSSAGRSLT